MRYFFLVTLVWGGCTCENSAEAPAGQEDQQAADRTNAPEARPDLTAPERPDSAAAAAARPRSQSMPRVLEGAPIGEEDMVARVIASGAPVPIFSRYDAKGAPPVATLKVHAGKTVPYSATRLVVIRPRRIRARQTMKLTAYTASVNKGGALKRNSSPFALKFSKGDQLSLLMYGGEGECLVYFQGHTLWLNVADPEHFSAPGWDHTCRAAEDQWWIRVKRGWVQVDGVTLRGKLVMWND